MSILWCKSRPCAVKGISCRIRPWVRQLVFSQRNRIRVPDAMLVKRTPLKKKSQQPISKIQRQLWELCKQITRRKYGNVCYTCGKTGLEGSGWHTGHMLPKASLGAFLKYDLRLLRPQCYSCNINLGGNGARYIELMREREGNRYVNQILKDQQIITKAYDHYLLLIDKYKNILSNL